MDAVNGADDTAVPEPHDGEGEQSADGDGEHDDTNDCGEDDSKFHFICFVVVCPIDPSGNGTR